MGGGGGSNKKNKAITIESNVANQLMKAKFETDNAVEVLTK